MSDLKELTKSICEFRDARDWKQFHTAKDMALSLLIESAECAEHFQFKNAEEISEHLSKNREEVADELADVLYWVLLLANDFDINIEESFKRKMKKNEAKYPVEKSRGDHRKYSEF